MPERTSASSKVFSASLSFSPLAKPPSAPSGPPMRPNKPVLPPQCRPCYLKTASWGSIQSRPPATDRPLVGALLQQAPGRQCPLLLNVLHAHARSTIVKPADSWAIARSMVKGEPNLYWPKLTKIWLCGSAAAKVPKLRSHFSMLPSLPPEPVWARAGRVVDKRPSSSVGMARVSAEEAEGMSL